MDSNNPRWNEWLEFLYLPDIPHSAKICFSICSVSKKKNKKVKRVIGNHWALSRKVNFNFRLYLEIADKCYTQFIALNVNVETIVVYTQEYLRSLSMFELGQMSCLNARGPPIMFLASKYKSNNRGMCCMVCLWDRSLKLLRTPYNVLSLLWYEIIWTFFHTYFRLSGIIFKSSTNIYIHNEYQCCLCDHCLGLCLENELTTRFVSGEWVNY